MKKMNLREPKPPNSSVKSDPIRKKQHRKLSAALDGHCAGSTISKRLIGWLFRNLSRSFRQVDGGLISVAISQACLGHRRNPQAFNAGCGVPLEHYLLFKAARNLADVIETQRRFSKNPRPIEQIPNDGRDAMEEAA